MEHDRFTRLKMKAVKVRIPDPESRRKPRGRRMQEVGNGTRTDDMNGISSLGARYTDQKVVGLDVAVNEVARVDVLDPRNLKQELSLLDITREQDHTS